MVPVDTNVSLITAPRLHPHIKHKRKRKPHPVRPYPCMNTQGFAIAIMAAGKGTRLRSKRPKVLHEIGGKALLLHVIAAAKTVVPADQIYCIIGHEADRVRAAVAPTGVQFVPQPEQRGTGHALQMVKAFFALSNAPLPKHLLVLSGDVPLIRPETIASICDFHLRERAAMTILTAVPADPTGYGRVIRAAIDKPEVTAIVEQKSLQPHQLHSPETREIKSAEAVSLTHWRSRRRLASLSGFTAASLGPLVSLHPSASARRGTTRSANVRPTLAKWAPRRVEGVHESTM